MRGSPTYIVLVTLLPGSVGLGLHLPGSPEPNSGCRSYITEKTEQIFYFYLNLNKNKVTAQLEIWKKMT